MARADCTEWTLSDGDEDAAFAAACDAHDLCIECGSTDALDDGAQFCASCVTPDPWMVDTALSTDGNHDVTTGGCWLVRFGGRGDVIVSDRYVGTDEAGAQDIAAGLMVEQHAAWFTESGEEPHETLMERAHDAIRDTALLAVRYARGKERNA